MALQELLRRLFRRLFQVRTVKLVISMKALRLSVLLAKLAGRYDGMFIMFFMQLFSCGVLIGTNRTWGVGSWL